MTSGVYKIKCVENNKVYIGRSFNIERRWQDHQRNTNKRLKKDMVLYGVDKFELSIIERASDLEELKRLEGYYIGLHSSHLDSKGYNINWRDPSLPKRSVNNEHEQRVNIDIDKELWRKVGIEAATKGITRRDIVTQALKKLLEEE